MLSIYPASTENRANSRKLGLAVAGGGPLGAIYELGALQALDEVMEGAALHEMDVYVGVSAGSFIASGLANGISVSQMCRIFIENDESEHVFNPEVFLKPASESISVEFPRSRRCCLPALGSTLGIWEPDGFQRPWRISPR